MRNKLFGVVIGAALMAGATAGPIAIPAAWAAGMDINATGGDGTQIDRDGTQGELLPAVQGSTDGDGYQDAHLTSAEEAAPRCSGAHE